MAQVPLFPLGTVLVPGASLPLQIFEPRYVEMLSDLVNAMDVPEFGVVAIRQGHEVGADSAHDLHEVGCLAKIVQAASVGDGRYLVVSTGTRRFHLDAMADAGTAYLTAEVTVLEERRGDEQEVADLATRLREALRRYAETLGAEEPEWPDERGRAVLRRRRLGGARPRRATAAARGAGHRDPPAPRPAAGAPGAGPRPDPGRRAATPGPPLEPELTRIPGGGCPTRATGSGHDTR